MSSISPNLLRSPSNFVSTIFPIDLLRSLSSIFSPRRFFSTPFDLSLPSTPLLDTSIFSPYFFLPFPSQRNSLDASIGLCGRKITAARKSFNTRYNSVSPITYRGLDTRRNEVLFSARGGISGTKDLTGRSMGVVLGRGTREADGINGKKFEFLRSWAVRVDSIDTYGRGAGRKKFLAENGDRKR